jgi:hypothetical protein
MGNLQSEGKNVDKNWTGYLVLVGLAKAESTCLIAKTNGVDCQDAMTATAAR